MTSTRSTARRRVTWSQDFERIGWPGEFPFTRGLHATGYRGKPWTIRQFAGFGNADDTNERYKMILAEGGHGLSVAFDMPTLMGRDSDDPRAIGEVGHCGVAIDSAADMETLFDGIDLGQVTTSMTISGPAVPVFCMYLVAAERQGVGRRGAERHSADRHLQGVHRAEGVDLPAGAASAADRRPDGVLHRADAGLQAAVGLRLPHPGGRLDCRAGARLHAGRRLRLRRTRAVPRPGRQPVRARAELLLRRAHRLLRGDREIPCGAADLGPLDARCLRRDDPRAQWLRFHTQTAGVSLTAQQPDNNVTRTAVEALAAVLGGTNSLHTNALDEVLALPSAKSAQIALRTQQVIMEETGVINVADPLGGSWYVEALTDRMEAEAERDLHPDPGSGRWRCRPGEHPIGEMTSGILRGIEDGYFTGEIADAAFAYIDRGGEGREEGGRGQLPDRRGRRRPGDPADLGRGRDRAERAAGPPPGRPRRRGGQRDGWRTWSRPPGATGNMVPAMLDAVRAEATLGEICDALRAEWGIYTEPARI